MTNNDEHLNQIVGYSYQIWNYQRSHSVLTLRATHADKPRHNIHLVFVDVLYMQLPLSWVGDLYVGSDERLKQIARRTNLRELLESLEIPIIRQLHSLYQSKSFDSDIYILGKLHAIEYDVEPLYL